MTKYTRRSFVKRTGSTTLGTVLGLGLLPSLTRKLHAADTSTSAIRLQLSSSPKVDETSVPGSCSQEYSYASSIGGTEFKYSIRHEFPNVLPGQCVGKITAVRKRTAEYTKYVGGKKYYGKLVQVRNYPWICVYGSPVLLIEEQPPSPTQVDIYCVAPYVDPTDKIGQISVSSSQNLENPTGGSFAGEVNLNGTYAKEGRYFETGYLSYGLSCCL